MYDFIKEIYGDQINARLLANTKKVTQQVTLATKADMVRNMLVGNEPLDKIVRYAGVPLAEVERLRDEAASGAVAR